MQHVVVVCIVYKLSPKLSSATIMLVEIALDELGKRTVDRLAIVGHMHPTLPYKVHLEQMPVENRTLLNQILSRKDNLICPHCVAVDSYETKCEFQFVPAEARLRFHRSEYCERRAK